jgi:hypothetical protein
MSKYKAQQIDEIHTQGKRVKKKTTRAKVYKQWQEVF